MPEDGDDVGDIVLSMPREPLEEELVGDDVGDIVSMPREPSTADGAMVGMPREPSVGEGGGGTLGAPQRMHELQDASPSQMEVQSSVHMRHLFRRGRDRGRDGGTEGEGEVEVERVSREKKREGG